MPRSQSHTMPKPLRFLLETGSMAGMTDRELVERFATSRDCAGEAAFAVIVSRHGPMVLATCRSLVGDRHAADDAFQAVFLVLARRAGSIRQPELLAPGCTPLPPRSPGRPGRRLIVDVAARTPRSK